MTLETGMLWGGVALLCLIVIYRLGADAGAHPRRAARVGAFLVVIAALGLYSVLGNPGITAPPPVDAAGWAALGQERMEAGRYAESAEAYRRAVLLSGGEPRLVLQHAKSLVFRSGGEVGEDAAGAFALVLVAMPGNPEARYFLALRDLQQGRAEAAMKVFKALYADLPDDAPLKRIMKRQIGRE